MKQVNMEQDARLSVIERIGYGLGDYANDLVVSSINAFLLVYYTNVVGANAAIAASIIAIMFVTPFLMKKRELVLDAAVRLDLDFCRTVLLTENGKTVTVQQVWEMQPLFSA